MKTRIGKTFRYAFGIMILSSLFLVGSAFAASGQNLGQLAQGITTSFSGIATLLIAISYLAGIGFVLASIFKFKQHKDNPTQIPLGTPLAMLVIGIVLIFLPMIFEPAGNTIFGTGAKAGGVTGSGFSTLPGNSGSGN